MGTYDILDVTTASNLNSTNITLNSSSKVEDDGFYYRGAEHLEKLYYGYKDYHGYIATVVCAFGILANILNIVVLTRKNMISATNCILTGLAVSDGLTMVVYMPFALRFYCLYGTEPGVERNTLPAVRFMLFYACFSVVVHSVSIWLTVTLAVFRYIFIKYPRTGATWCSLRQAKVAVLTVYVVTLLVCVPNFVTIDVRSHYFNATHDIWIVMFKTETKTEQIVHDFNFWIQAILVKLVPCVGLTILSILLVRTMNKAEQRRQNLRKNCGMANRKDESGRDRKTNRTTRMLLVVVGLFLLTEFPQGILNLLSGILPNFVNEIYMPLGDLMDILALINNGINFILYCTMSKQFRDTFIESFLVPLKRHGKHFTPVPTNTNGTTTNTEL